MSKTSPKRVLIVGAGLTGSMLSQLLRRGTAAAAAHPDNSVSVWDKSRGSGGRAGTSRVSSSGAKGDLGLQYLSTSPNPDTGEIHPMYSQLVDAGVIAPMGCRLVGMNPKYVDPTKQHFVAVEGASSLAKHFLNTDGVDVSYSKTVTAIARAPTAEDSGGSSGWVVSTSDDDGGSAPEVFDSVVLTAPMPQVRKTTTYIHTCPFFNLFFSYRSWIFFLLCVLVRVLPRPADIHTHTDRERHARAHFLPACCMNDDLSLRKKRLISTALHLPFCFFARFVLGTLHLTIMMDAVCLLCTPCIN